MQINSYDDYGVPATTNLGRFQYTGQTWLPEVGLYYYKARIYSPTLGRFLQTDPIGLSCSNGGYCDPNNPEDDGPPINVIGYGAISDGGGGGIITITPVELGVPSDIFGGEGGGGVALPVGKANDKKMSNRMKRSLWACLLASGKKNGVNLALDAGGIALVFVSVEFQVAAAVGGSLLGLIGIGTSIASKDPAGAGLAYGGKLASGAGGVAKAGSVLARAASRFGAGAVVVSTVRDVTQAVADFQKCRAGIGQ